MSIIFSRLSQRLKPFASGLIKFKKPQFQPPKALAIRKSGNYVPRNQYDVPLPPMLNDIVHMMVQHYEVTPLILIVAFDLLMVISFILYCIYNKMDVVFFGESRGYISRTMNLRAPTIHKLFTVNIENYRPWDEMQKVLDNMAFAEFMKKNKLCTSLIGEN